MCQMNIRRRTEAETDAARERAEEKYERIVGEIEDKQRADYETEFGAAYRAKHPFQRDGANIHFEALRRLTSK